jgi:hypothetical protein
VGVWFRFRWCGCVALNHRLQAGIPPGKREIGKAGKREAGNQVADPAVAGQVSVEDEDEDDGTDPPSLKLRRDKPASIGGAP